ncbi:MAG: hypothetical protein TREMPRED_005353 [Tremellales sp. Tagirdzhanova-0007]|nr:MAG: hypothetical protein TREMPRED_005353 [Tremellales sp. Tagirdzhanova-0007]
MTSPPSLEPLQISNPPGRFTSAKTSTPASGRPPSPSPSPPESRDDAPEMTGPSKQFAEPIAGEEEEEEDTPPPTPAADIPSPPAPITATPPAASTSTHGPPLPRPQPPPSMVSAPNIFANKPIPGRPSPAMMARGGMPVPLGMRGPMGKGDVSRMPTRLPPSLQAKMDNIAATRSSAPVPQNAAIGPNGTSMSALLRSQALGGGVTGITPGPASGPLSLASRRAGPGIARPSLGSMGMGASAPGGMGARAGLGSGIGGRRMGPPGGLTLSGMKGAPAGKAEAGNKFTDFGKIMDPSGSLRFSSKAVLTAKGVDFEDGASFKINMDEIEVVGELGKGNYGAEIRLELDESKLSGIIMELDVLHRAVAPEIVEFYGAFTIESCVYYCMEYMDAGSLEALTGGGIPAKSVKPDVDAAPESRGS